MNNDGFQYDSCVSKGICSINPRTYALQRVLVLYLILFSRYFYELYKNGIVIEEGKELILNTTAIAVSNPEFTESSFTMSVERFKEILPNVVEKYKSFCEEKGIKVLETEYLNLLEESDNLNRAIRFGEKDMQKFQTYSEKIRDLLRILLSVVKSVSINLLDLESFGEKNIDVFETVLKIYNMFVSPDEEKIKEQIYLASELDNKLMKRLREIQEELYGKQRSQEVSYSTVPGKAVLVVGSNIRELENVLIELGGEDIDVYTHDDMMLAHTFPKFNDYKNLKGQYGQGVENCLLDFATFPGPIILTKHSLHNIENFYRGRLFTTDYTSPKGVIKILNNDFSEVIKSANDAKGFKSGKQCESVEIGYDFDIAVREITERLNSGKYKNLLMIGAEYNNSQNSYFEKMVKLLPSDVFVVSLSYKQESENFYHINTCFDTITLVKLYDEFYKKLPVSVIIPKCDRNSVSEMIYFSKNKDTKVFVGVCTPIILNPMILNTFDSVFGIKQITSARNDLKLIFGLEN